MRISLEYDQEEGILTDRNGAAISWHGVDGFEKNRALAPSEYCQLISSGLTREDIKELMDEGVIA